MAALINGAILVGASIFIVYGAAIRFGHPEPVAGRIVMILAGIGILGSGKIRHELYHRFGIDHPILQFETVRCGNGGILCEIPSAGK